MTAAGAAAYAHFYGRRLPTVDEWLYAVDKSAKKEAHAGTLDMDSDMGSNDMANMETMHAMMMEGQKKSDASSPGNLAEQLSPVSAFKENQYGVRTMDSGFGEWSLVRKSSFYEEPLNFVAYMIMPLGVTRQPWEAFEEVGFRCARDIERAVVNAK